MVNYYRIVSLANQQVIGLPEYGDWHNNIDLVSRDWVGTTLQLFRLDPDGDYVRIMSLANRKVFDVVGQYRIDGTHVQVYDDTGNDNQRWKKVEASFPNDSWFFQSKLDGRFLTLGVHQPHNVDGFYLEEWDIQFGQRTQLWSVEKRTQGPYKIVGWNGLVVDVPGGQSADGLQVQQYHDHNGANQQWLLVRVGDDTHPGGVMGEYFKIVCEANGLVLPVPADGPQANAPVQQGFDIHGDNQKWLLIPSVFEGIPDYVKIASALDTNFVLDVPDARTDDGVKLQVFPDNGGGNQKWQFVVLPA